MEETKRVRRPHTLRMEDRKKVEFTGITDVISFEPAKVILESDYGMITIKGEGLHVNKLSVEKGELDVDGRVDGFVYTETSDARKKGESFVSRLFR
ncbi:MAG: sporulation protein YabP [Eubacteriales bacterium]|nr:sporulation protein YabP [Eubacteriales bacterium]